MMKDFKNRVNDEYARLLQQASMVRAIP
jgi:hypothetical protein